MKGVNRTSKTQMLGGVGTPLTKDLTGDDHGAATGAIFGGISGAVTAEQAAEEEFAEWKKRAVTEANNTGVSLNFRTEVRCSKITYYTNE